METSDNEKKFREALGELSVIPEDNHQLWDLHPYACGYISPAEPGPALARIWVATKENKQS